MRSASTVARWLLEFGDWRARHQDLSRAITGAVLLILGLLLIASAAITDIYLHRGVESGAEQPYVVQPSGKGMATNVDLRPFNVDDRNSVIAAIDDAGFEFVRQPVRWADLEPEQGQFDWTLLNGIVSSLDRYDMQLIVVVTGTPEWAWGALPAGVEDGPPESPAAFQDFLTAMTTEFQGTLPYIQIWDKPNTAGMWDGNIASGQDFLPLLSAGYNGAKAGYSNVRIISPELAANEQGGVPGIPEDDSFGETDLQFMQQLYDQGGEAFFDVLGIQLDGGTLSPDDRRVNSGRINFSRAILFRELMLREGDTQSPVWATSYGWAATGNVSRDEQAEFVSRGLDRSWSEWPWMGLAVQWSFLPARSSPDAAYSIILQDGTDTPLYQRLIERELAARAARANTGFTPMNSSSVSYTGRWQDQDLENRTFRTTSQVGSTTTLEFQGTGLIAFVRSGPQVGGFKLEVDGKIIPGGGGADGTTWDLVDEIGTNDYPRTLVSGLDDGPHALSITLLNEGELTIGGFEVLRDAPFVWPVVLMTIAAMILLFFGLRAFAYLVAVRAGHLSRRNPIELGPQLPQIPNWRPGRRT